MNILIISATIFPAQFPRSYRASELAKELSRQGHDVTLYAILGDHDYSQYEKKHNLRVRNIGKMLFAISNSDGVERRNITDRVLGRIFHRLIEFPDIEIMFKIPRIINSEKNVDLIISIAWPFPIHWGVALAKCMYKYLFPKIWIADCGDPYMGNKVSHKDKYFYFEYIEKWFCREADYITVPVKGAIEAYYPEFINKIKVIPQGFKYDDKTLYIKETKNDVPTFAYSGNFYKGIRDPAMFLEYLTTINSHFKFIVYTKNKECFEPYLCRLGDKIEVRDYIPRERLLNILNQMDFLINFDNGTNVQSPSKLIDYAIVKKPILSINPNSLPLQTIIEFFNGDYSNSYVVENIEQYNISTVAKQFTSLAIYS